MSEADSLCEAQTRPPDIKKSHNTRRGGRFGKKGGEGGGREAKEEKKGGPAIKGESLKEQGGV